MEANGDFRNEHIPVAGAPEEKAKDEKSGRLNNGAELKLGVGRGGGGAGGMNEENLVANLKR